MKNIKKLVLIFSLIILFSCNEEVNNSIDIQNQLSISILNNTLKFENNDYLKESLEKNNKENLNSNLRKFRKQGFKALRPIFDLNDNDAIDLFLSEKRNRLKNNKILYSKESENDDDIDLDDELIADDSFASILNEEREVYVGDKFYKYTTIGLFYCKIENEAHLRNYLDSLENTAEGKLFIKNKLTQKSFNSNCNPEIVNLMAPEGSFNEVDDMITLFIPELSDCNGDGNTGGGSGTGTGDGAGTGSYTNPNINSDMKILIPQGLQPCNYAQNSLWQQTFGNRVKCNDYHDGNHRVQTQFWSQNYFLWSDIGTKVKYQRKRSIGWSQSTAADYLELGINNVHYIYNHNFNQTTPIALSPVQFKYKGLTYDMFGNQISYPVNPNPWPFYNANQTFFNLDVFVDSNFLPPVNANITFGDVNKGIEAVLKLAKRNLPSLSGLNNDLANNKVGVRIVNNLPNKTEIIVANKVNGGDFEKIDHNFDFNFLLTFDVLDGFDLADILKQFQASKYDVLNVDIYGMATKDGILKGRRIIGKD